MEQISHWKYVFIFLLQRKIGGRFRTSRVNFLWDKSLKKKKKICLLGPILTYFGGKSSSPSLPKGYKNQSSNLILPKVPNLFPWPRDSILIVFFGVNQWWFNPKPSVCCQENSLKNKVLLLASNPCFFFLLLSTLFHLIHDLYIKPRYMIQYGYDTALIQENFKIQDTIRLGYFNKKNKFKQHIKTQNAKYGLKLKSK